MEVEFSSCDEEVTDFSLADSCLITHSLQKTQKNSNAVEFLSGKERVQNVSFPPAVHSLSFTVNI